MLKLNLLLKRSVMILMLIFGLAGTIFFFPLQFDDQSSCCYERMFGSDEDCSCGNETKDHSQHHPPMHTGTDSLMNTSDMHVHGSALLDSYLHHYAFPWWISVGVLVIGCFWWVREKDKRQKTKEKKK